MKLSRASLPVVLAGFLSAGFLLHASAAEPAKPKSGQASKDKTANGKMPGLATPDYIPEAARPILRKKMERHGQDARDLMFSVTLLQYDMAKAAAQRIASEPRLVRPIVGGEDDLNALLPERFFVLQDEARTRAQTLSIAAEKKDDKALAESYGRLVETCVACHSAYLNRQ
ncbi:cytochrome c [Hyalangium gracile]|uniref:cytochrome c n=1 Tax=Hyalangium gracile TaxID=394092 RepID=UPI001CC92414|nr:cytochrome c [Hyalangium gracile]